MGCEHVNVDNEEVDFWEDFDEESLDEGFDAFNELADFEDEEPEPEPGVEEDSEAVDSTPAERFEPLENLDESDDLNEVVGDDVGAVVDAGFIFLSLKIRNKATI